MPTKNQNNIPVFHMMMLGAGGVGKSAITVRYVQKLFTEDYDPTIQDFYKKKIEYEGKTYLIEILDTSGDSQFSVMKDTYIKKMDGFILVYGVDERSSYEQIEEIRKDVLTIKDLDQVPMMIVGNKCDLDKRAVSTEEGKIFSSKCPGSEFLESSAKNNKNIDEIYLTLLKNLLKERNNTTKCACNIS